MAQDFRDTRLPKPEIAKEGPPEGPGYPSLHLPLKFVLEAEKWPMDKDYELTLRVKVSSVTTRKGEEEEEDGEDVSFEITGLKVGEGAGDYEKEKEENSRGSYRERG
jgi:hypothetical protein